MSKAAKLAGAYHNLAVMLDAGMPILRSLDTIASTSQGSLKKVFAQLHQSVSKGNSLSDSMARYGSLFARLDVMLVAASETSGRLPQCFHLLSKWYEFRRRLQGKMLAGFILPLFVLHIIVVAVPIPSMVLGDLTMRDYIFRVLSALFFMYTLIVLSFVIYRLMRKVGFLDYPLDAVILKIPVLGLGVRHLSICRYCRAFNLLYKSGVPIIESLKEASALTGNRLISRLFKGGSASAARGDPAWQGFSGGLPVEYLNLWQVGEETGELDKMADKIAEIAGNKAELYLTEFARWLPRLAYFLICIWMIIQIFKGYGNLYSIPEF